MHILFPWRLFLLCALTTLALACGPLEEPLQNDPPAGDDGGKTAKDEEKKDKADDSDDSGNNEDGASPFATRVIEFSPGPGAGFGTNKMPDVVLGPPKGNGDRAGSLDVVSLGNEGVIILAFDEMELVDGPGPDLLVFENPFSGFVETGFVAVSEDGETWHEWPCDPIDKEGGYPGCAGVNPVHSHPDNGIDPTDPEVAGGDAFDLADLPIKTARFVRIRDTGENEYLGSSGGFDLDAVAIVNGKEVEEE